MGEYMLEIKFKRAMADLRGNKTPASDDIFAELIYNLGDQATEFLYHLSNRMYEGGVIPEEFKKPCPPKI